MMKRVILIVSICFSATVCFAQEEYSNSKWHFSFTLPEWWEVITEDVLLNEYEEVFENRFENAEILALCQEVGYEGEGNSVLVRARSIGDVKEGLVFEELLEERIHSQSSWEVSNSYLKDFRRKLIEEGEVTQKTEYQRRIYYDSDRHIHHETIVLVLIETYLYRKIQSIPHKIHY